ncbi:MAG: hypothetical protein ACNA7M_04910 [Roseovarius sp.]
MTAIAKRRIGLAVPSPTWFLAVPVFGPVVAWAALGVNPGGLG